MTHAAGRKKDKPDLISMSLMFIAGIFFIFMNGCSNNSDSDAPVQMVKSGDYVAVKISPSSIMVQNGQDAGFDAFDGVPPYTWFLTGGGSLSAAGGSSVVYTAPAPAEHAVLTVTDGNGYSATADIAPAFTPSTLIMEPDIIDSFGEVTAIFNLLGPGGVVPQAGSSVTFTIIQGPANFIDADGADIGDSSTGTSPTDTNGNVFARIRAGDTIDTTNVIIQAASDTDVIVTEKFTIERNLGLISFNPGPESYYPGTLYTVAFPFSGALPPEFLYILPFHVEHTDGSGNPLANQDIELGAYLRSESIISITLGDSSELPYTVLTDDDGLSDFVLYVRVKTPEPTDEFAALNNIGSLVLTGDSIYGVRGSMAIIFRFESFAGEEALIILPSSAKLSEGQEISLNAAGGVPPYTWSCSGGNDHLNSTEGSSVIYTAPAPFTVSEVVTVTDDADDTFSATIWTD